MTMPEQPDHSSAWPSDMLAPEPEAARTMGAYLCVRCGLPITDGMMRGMGDGSGQRFGHNDCYWRTEAERMERERDAARGWAARWRAAARAYRARHEEGAASRADIIAGLLRTIEERDAARAELQKIGERVGRLDGESVYDAAQDMAAEHEHYSNEMARAGYETIPKLEDDLKAALAEARALRAAGDRMADAFESREFGLYESFINGLRLAVSAWHALAPTTGEGGGDA